MPDNQAAHGELGQSTWLHMAGGLIVTWLLHMVGVRLGIPVTLEGLRIALALWRQGTRGV